MKNPLIIFSALFVFLISIIIFYSIYQTSDLYLHSNIAIDSAHNGNSLPTNFIYYKMILLFGGINNIKFASIFILSLFVVLKFFVTFKYLLANAHLSSRNKEIILISIAILFLSPLYLTQYIFFNRFYIGSFPLNIWHNSTIIASMPFAVLLFWQTCTQLESWSNLRLFFILALIPIITFIKPSYLFVYIVTLPLVALITKKYFFKALGIAFFAGFIILIQIYYQYLNNSTDPIKHTIEISPFLVYHQLHGSHNSLVLVLGFFAISLVLSLLLPIYHTFTTKKQSVALLFAKISMIAAVGLSILFIENGPRLLHWNFFWQIPAAAYILFLVTVSEALPKLLKTPNKLKINSGQSYYAINTYQILFLLHLIFGSTYVMRLIFFKTYY